MGGVGGWADLEPTPFPDYPLRAARTGLVLFAAAFQGRQDAYWFAHYGVRTTCVDTDAAGLAKMRELYPSDWEFVHDDAWDFARGANAHVWDVVSLDPFTNLFQLVADSIHEWTRLATRYVVMGCGVHTRVVAPGGWKVVDMVKRSQFHGGIYWAVLEAR